MPQGVKSGEQVGQFRSPPCNNFKRLGIIPSTSSFDCLLVWPVTQFCWKKNSSSWNSSRLFRLAQKMISTYQRGGRLSWRIRYFEEVKVKNVVSRNRKPYSQFVVCKGESAIWISHLLPINANAILWQLQESIWCCPTTILTNCCITVDETCFFCRQSDGNFFWDALRYSTVIAFKRLMANIMLNYWTGSMTIWRKYGRLWPRRKSSSLDYLEE